VLKEEINFKLIKTCENWELKNAIHIHIENWDITLAPTISNHKAEWLALFNVQVVGLFIR